MNTAGSIIEETRYHSYLDALLAGQRSACQAIVEQLLQENIGIKTLYQALFQQSLYQVGELWETNRITVAKEHVATSITESLLHLVYPTLFATERCGKKAIISCSANEYHQIGGKMVADILELNGWDGYFIGANADPDDLLRYIDEMQPDFVGFSLSLLPNIKRLKLAVEKVRHSYPHLQLLVGGQAFRWGGSETISHFAGVSYVESLEALERVIHE